MNTSVRGADRALMIFEAFEAAKRQLTLREIAEQCGLPLSSCHALVQTLLRRGYLYTVGRRKELYPNSRLFTLARTIVEHDPFLSRFSADFEALRDQCGETVTVAKRHGEALQYLLTLDCPQLIRYAARSGDIRPLHATANGKALLSVLREEELELWMETAHLERTTARTITRRSRLLKDIEVGRKRGYFLSQGEYSDDLDAVAVPVVLDSDVITVAVAGPSHRLRPSAERIAGRLMALKKRLETDVAGFPPTARRTRSRGRADQRARA
jgi:DNA-binding IclR family transcriptional regulator